MDEDQAYVILLNSQPEDETYYEAVSLSHSKFTKTYYLVVDSVPLNKKLPNGQDVTFSPANITPSNAQNSNDLDQLASFSIADLENIYDDELSNIPLGDNESPVIGYYVYVSDHDLPAQFIEYTAKSIAQASGAFTIKCGAPDLNKDETGEVFDLERFPMLRGT